jgi:hypothetical protein
MTEMRDHARKAVGERHTQGAAEQKVQQITAQNPTLVNAGASECVFYVVMLLALPTVYFIDVMLLGPVAGFLASQGFDEGSLIARIAPYVVPLAVIGLETVVGAFRMAAYRDYLGGDATAAMYKALSVFAALLAFFIPAAGLALYLGEDTTVPGTTLGKIVLFVPVALPIALSLTCHLCILLGSRRMHEAKTWWAVRQQCRTLRDSIEKARHAFGRESTAAADILPFYLQDLDEYNGTFQPTLAAGPFDQNTRAIVNEVYGYEAIRTAGAQPPAAEPSAAPNGAATGPTAAQPRQDATNSDEPNWEELHRLQQRDDESEVRA